MLEITAMKIEKRTTHDIVEELDKLVGEEDDSKIQDLLNTENLKEVTNILDKVKELRDRPTGSPEEVQAAQDVLDSVREQLEGWLKTRYAPRDEATDEEIPE